MLAVTALGVGGHSVVGDRLPGRGVGDELADARPDAGIVVEGSHADADRIGVARIAAEERGATVAAEPFLAAAVRLPHAKPVLTRDDPKCAGCGVRIRRRCRATPALAALAVAVAGDGERRSHLEPNGPAVAASCEAKLRHLAHRPRPSS